MSPATPEIPPQTHDSATQNQSSHGITVLAAALFVLASLVTIAFLYYQNQALKKMLAAYQSSSSPTPTTVPTDTGAPTATASAKPFKEPKGCTLEAKLCPDGSYVGREGPNCEFAPCPPPQR